MSFAACLVVRSANDTDFYVGTGYAISSRIVITAAHVVGNLNSSLRVRFGTDDWHDDVSIAWYPSGATPDVCLLKLATPTALPASVRWGVYTREQPTEVDEIRGFPTVARITALDGAVLREAAGVRGYLTCSGGLQQGLYELVVDGPPPAPADWGGLSGAAVFCDGHLIGLVHSVLRAASSRLWVTPTAALLKDVQFASFVGHPVAKEVPRVLGLQPLITQVTLPTAPPPSQLLDPRYGAVDYIDEVHVRERDILRDWCDTKNRLSAALVTGPGGSGKTRLLIELCRHLRETRNWRAGFVMEGVSDERIRRMSDVRCPVLLVFDYAERRAELATALQTLSYCERPRRLRVILLSREPGDWWTSLRYASSMEVRELLEPPFEVSLRPITLDGRLRQLVFAQSAESFAKRLLKPVPPDAPNLDHRRFSRVLYLQMAALAAVEGLTLSPRELLGAVLEHEERFWLRYFADRHKRLALASFAERARRAVAALTLFGSADISTAEKLFTLAGVEKRDCEEFRRLLAILYPSPTKGTLRGLEPDLLGEALVAEVLGDDNDCEFLTEIALLAGAQQLLHVFTVLDAVEDGGYRADKITRIAIRSLIEGDLEQCIVPAFRAAMASSATSSSSFVAGVLSEQVTVPLKRAQEILPLLPKSTVSLLRFAVLVTQRCLDAVPTSHTAERAALYDLLSIRLHMLGQYTEAWSASKAAVDLYGELCAQDKDFLRGLAGSRTNLANRYVALNKPREALEVAQQAVQGFRELGETSEPVLSDLAASLQAQALAQMHLRTLSEAVKSAQGAVKALLRARESREQRGLLPDIALAYANLGFMLSEVGDSGSGLAAAELAVDIYSELWNSCNAAFIEGLARALHNYAIVLSRAGRPLESTKPAAFAVAIRRELAGTCRDAFYLDLALSLVGLGNRLREIGLPEVSIQHFEEAAAIYRQAEPQGMLVVARQLADCQNNLAGSLTMLGRLEKAEVAATEAVEIYRLLAKQDAVSAQSGLAACLYTLSMVTHDLGSWQPAESLAAEALAMYRALVIPYPDVYRPHLARTLDLLASAQAARQDFATASATAEEAVSVLRRHEDGLGLTETSLLASSLQTLGGILADMSNWEGAASAFRESSSIWRALVELPAPPALAATRTSLLRTALQKLVVALERASLVEEATAAAKELDRLSKPETGEDAVQT